MGTSLLALVKSILFIRDAVKGHENGSNKALTISTRILRLFVNFSQLTMISIVVCVNSPSFFIISYY